MNKIFISLTLILITQSVFADMSCDVSIDKYFAVYGPNQHTCSSGYYLPANTDGCRACPTGFNCPGGTFEFNVDEFQGLSFESVPNNTMNNICAANFPKKMFAVYEPNTITINWDDGTNTVQNTCTYGGTITLPPTPVRPGYKFGGWRIKKQN